MTRRVPRGGWVLAVDPGQAACGVALFYDGELSAADWVRHPGEHNASLESLRTMAQAVAAWWSRFYVGLMPPMHLICEKPQAYYGAKSQAPAADLMPMWAIDGALAALLPGASCEAVYPKEWGATGKPARGQLYEVEVRVRGRLTPAEAMRLAPVPKSYRHNMFDAIAIGMHATGRSLADRPKRVITR